MIARIDLIFLYGEMLIDLADKENTDKNTSDLSPEEFLAWIEDQIEAGELTIDEIKQYISDYNQRGK
jgi:hypothetical protein